MNKHSDSCSRPRSATHWSPSCNHSEGGRGHILCEHDSGSDTGSLAMAARLPVVVFTRRSHAHGDHARWGSRHYLASREGGRVLRTRLGNDANIEFADFGEPRTYGPGDVLHRFRPMLKRMDDGRPEIVFPESLAQWRSPRGYV